MNLAQLISEAIGKVPDRTALVVGDDRLTYGDLDVRADRCASALAAAGVRPSDTVVLADHGSPLAVTTLLGVARLGAACAAMNPELKGHETKALCELVGARVGVAGEGQAAKLTDVLPGAVITAEDILAADPLRTAPHRVEDEATALVLFSSGTTGLPKPVALSHRTIASRLSFYGTPVKADEEPQIDFMCVPIFHIGGALGLLITLFSGRTMVILPRFDAAAWLRIVEQHRIGQTFVVPTMLRRILDHPEFASRDLTSLQSLSYGAAPASVELIQRAIAALPGTALMNVFGQTETLGAYAALSPDDHRTGKKLDSVGRPFPGVELKVVEVESRAEVGVGQVGEALVRSAQNVTADWLPTGDLLFVDDEGYLFVTGRVKDVINRGGEKFGPAEIEATIRELPGIEDVAVAGVPDPDLGERVGALIVGDPAPTAADVQSHCRQRLARYKVPEIIVMVPELPYNRFGKLPRAAVVQAIEANNLSPHEKGGSAL